MFYATVEKGKLKLSVNTLRKEFFVYNPSEHEAAGEMMWKNCFDGDLGVMCSSSVDFADEDGWPEPNAHSFIDKAQNHALKLDRDLPDINEYRGEDYAGELAVAIELEAAVISQD
jgi:hypothetical protein